IISKNLEWENILKRSLVDDFTFTQVDLVDSEDLFGLEYHYKLLAVCLRRAAKKSAKQFRSFLKKHKRSKHKAMLRLIVFALESNERTYITEIYDLFLYLQEVDHLKQGNNFSLEFRKVFENALPNFNTDQ